MTGPSGRDGCARTGTRRPPRWRLWWALPWLLFQTFPLVDLVTTPRPAAVRIAAGAGLVVFTAAYVAVFGRLTVRGPSRLGALLLVAVLGAVLAATMGPAWVGLLIYVSAAAAIGLPQRWVWPAVAAATATSAAVLSAYDSLGELFVLPLLCVLTGFALTGTRHLVSVNADLVEARDELARNAVAEERLRFARDLHDLLGHSLSLIALKSELAGRLAERDPARARAEMADVEAAARRALAEVRDAVSGYRQVSLGQAVAEARSALSAAGIVLRSPATLPTLPGRVDAVLGWVVREAATNALRHSRAGVVTVVLDADEFRAVLTVTDDGAGPAAGGSGGAGLAGLAERLAAQGGRLDAGAGPGRGFRVRAEVPLTARAPADRVAAP